MQHISMLKRIQHLILVLQFNIDRVESSELNLKGFKYF